MNTGGSYGHNYATLCRVFDLVRYIELCVPFWRIISYERISNIDCHMCIDIDCHMTLVVSWYTLGCGWPTARILYIVCLTGMALAMFMP